MLRGAAQGPRLALERPPVRHVDRAAGQPELAGRLACRATLALAAAACVARTVGGSAAARGLRRRALSSATSRSQSQAHVAYVDVHCHLTHRAFGGEGDWAARDELVARCRAAGLSRVVVNGLEPVSNRGVLALCARHPDVLRAALGIYPLDASAHVIDEAEYREKKGEPPATFDVAGELDFIEAQ